MEQYSLPIDAVVKEELDETQIIEGLCSSCLGTGYLYGVRDGVLGLLSTELGGDIDGKRKRSLMRCDCSMDVRGI